MVRFKEFIEQDMTGIIPSTWSGSETHPNNEPWLPSLDVMIPSVKKTGKIVLLNKISNPILIQLDDGTKLYFTYSQYRRIHGEPSLGKLATVTFQRLPEDNRKILSKIEDFTVH